MTESEVVMVRRSSWVEEIVKTQEEGERGRECTLL